MIGEAFDVINDSPAKSYLDADDCSAALAAAELLAAAHGKGDERLHPDAAAWLKDHVDDVRKADIASARRAVQRLYDSSELRELWDDNGADTAWHLGVRELLARLA